MINDNHSFCELENKYQSILVNRRGNLENSTMITKSILSEIHPNKTYQILNTTLKEYVNETVKHKNIKNISITTPDNIIIEGNWNNNIKLTFSDSNILGDNGIFIIDSNYNIPIAETTIENLAYYNAYLYKIGDIIEFETNQSLPLTIVEIGKTYVDGYIYPIAGGIYCEKHNTPHYHQPLNMDSSGYLVIGKDVINGVQLSAFKIPFGYGIYMSPNTIHNDLFLVGSYLVVYAKANEYSTVIFRTSNNEPAKINIK